MTQQTPPRIQVGTTPEYRENYANSVQVLPSLWDFLLLFGRISQSTPEMVQIQNFQAVYMSPQQTKALLNLLQTHVNQYENTFGPISLEPQSAGGSVQ